MGAGRYDLVIDQGATFSRVFRFVKSDGLPLDLTGWTFVGEIRSPGPGGSLVAQFQFGVINPPTAGMVSVILPAAVTMGLQAPAEGEYDIFMVKDQEARVRLRGAVRVVPRVTQFQL